MAEWLNSAKTWGERALKQLDGLADQLVSQANEAQASILAEQSKLREENDAAAAIISAEKPLPWEASREDLAIFEHDVMEKILQLSLREENFTVPPKHLEYVTFVFSDFISVAMRLLQLDANLARMHARLASKMKEETFWHFYYYRIMFLRASIGIDGQSAKESALGTLTLDDVIIFQATRDYEAKDTADSVVRRRLAGQQGKLKSPHSAAKRGAAGLAAAGAAGAAGGGTGADGSDNDEGDAAADQAQANRKKAEAELAAEVQAELEAEDDLLDLDEFGDDGDDLGVLALGGEGGEDGDLDAELEAQIARELGESSP